MRFPLFTKNANLLILLVNIHLHITEVSHEVGRFDLGDIYSFNGSMFYHKIDRATPRLVIFHWLLLSFPAYLVERPLHRGKKPYYALVMSCSFLCLVLAIVFGSNGWFGSFGETHLKSDYLLLALLCMASGLQNAAVSCSSRHSIRISHMTGNTTDLGIGIVRVLLLEKNTPQYDDERSATWLRAGIIGAFVLGSAAGAVLFIHFHYFGFLLPASLALYITLYEVVISRKNEHLLMSSSFHLKSK